MKFLLMGDRHNSEQKPQSRIDDFYETQKAKDEEIMSIAKKYNVTAILQAGDFWTDSDYKIKNDFIPDIIKRWVNPFNPSESIPMIGIAGNHDLIGGNIRSLPNTTLGLTAALGYQRLVTKDDPIIFTMKNGKTIAITGSNYHVNMDKPEYIEDYIVDNKLGDYHIHIVHGMLSPKNLGKMIRHTTIDAIKDTKADITFCGHDHIGFDTIQYDNKYFINPGAVVRLKNDVKELTRVVKVILLTIDENGIFLEEIPLKSALNASLVLSREVVEQKKLKDAAAEKMKSEIKSLKISKKSKFSEILEDVFEKEEVSEVIMNDLRKRITEKEILNNSFLKVPTDVAIESITLENFQSHQNTTINLSKGFNVLLGESRQGKTAIMRAFRWVLENKPTGTSIIRHGAEKCSVTIKLQNGTYITRFISKKENGYRVILPDGSTQEGNTKMLGFVQSICGFNEMEVSKDKTLSVNFLRQGEGWYLMDDNTSSTERARILGSLQNTQSADAVVKDLDKENTQINTNIKNNTKQIDSALEEINKLTAEKEHMEKIKLLLEKMLLKEKIMEYLSIKSDCEIKTKCAESLTLAYNKISQDGLLLKIKTLKDKENLIISESQKAIAERKNISEAQTRITNCDIVIRNSDKIREIKSLSEKHNDIEINLKVHKREVLRQKQINSMLSGLSNYKEKLIPLIKELLLKKIEITEAVISCKKQVKTISAANNLIAASENVLTADKKIAEVNRLLDSRTIIVSELSKQKQLTQEILLSNKKIDASNKTEEQYKKQKAQILKDAKICPICSQIITDTVTNNILGGCSHE